METMEAVELEKQRHNNTRMEVLARLAKLEVLQNYPLFGHFLSVFCLSVMFGTKCFLVEVLAMWFIEG